MQAARDEIRELRQIITLLSQKLDDLEARLSYPIPHKESWITTNAAAAICKIDRSTLTRMALTGKCEAKKCGKQWRFPETRVKDMSFIRHG